MKYVFRGKVVLEYNKEYNQLRTTEEDGIPAINTCLFINDDYVLMEQFFKNINDYKKDNTIELKDIVVD